MVLGPQPWYQVPLLVRPATYQAGVSASFLQLSSSSVSGNLFQIFHGKLQVVCLLFFNIKKYIFILKHFQLILAVLGLSCSLQDLVLWLRIKPVPPALGAQSLSHWTTRLLVLNQHLLSEETSFNISREDYTFSQFLFALECIYGSLLKRTSEYRILGWSSFFSPTCSTQET